MERSTITNRRRRALVKSGLGVVLSASIFGAATIASSSADAQVVAGAVTAAYGVWDGDSPTSPADPSSDTVELGMSFKSASRGWVTAIRYYHMAAAQPATRGTLWSNNGDVLGRVSFAQVSVSGWQTAQLDHPVELSPNDAYVVSYLAPGGHYADDQDALGGGHSASSGDLTAFAGVYSESLGFPQQTWNDSNYYADVLFTTTDPALPTKSTPTSRTVSATSSASVAPTTSASIHTSAPVPSTTESTTDAVQSPTGKPGDSNTGVPSGRTLTPSGSLTLRTANQVIDGLDINGSVDVEAPGVVIKNSRIHGSDSYGVLVRSGSVTISDSELYGFENAIGGDDWKGFRLDIHGTYGDGVKLGSDVLLQDSWIHDLTPADGAHADGAQMQSGVVNLTVRHNVIDVSTATDANSAIFMAPDLGPSTDGPVDVTDNWLDGGNFTIFCVDGNNGQYFVQNISITGNRFGRHSAYGPSRVNVPILWASNVWDDTGAGLGL